MAGTPPADDDARHSAHAQVDAIIANLAAIGQAEGILMFVHGIDGDHAFELLKARARTAHVNISPLAAQFVNDVVALTVEERLDMKSACNRLLLSPSMKRIRRAPEGS